VKAKAKNEMIEGILQRHREMKHFASLGNDFQGRPTPPIGFLAVVVMKRIKAEIQPL
jgi:hypothetical protein